MQCILVSRHIWTHTYPFQMQFYAPLLWGNTCMGYFRHHGVILKFVTIDKPHLINLGLFKSPLELLTRKSLVTLVFAFNVYFYPIWMMYFETLTNVCCVLNWLSTQLWQLLQSLSIIYYRVGFCLFHRNHDYQQWFSVKNHFELNLNIVSTHAKVPSNTKQEIFFYHTFGTW